MPVGFSLPLSERGPWRASRASLTKCFEVPDPLSLSTNPMKDFEMRVSQGVLFVNEPRQGRLGVLICGHSTT